jgi:hypothetical protein
MIDFGLFGRFVGVSRCCEATPRGRAKLHCAAWAC